MFKKDTEVLTVLEGWVKIQNLKLGQLIWDGNEPVEVVGLHNYEFYRYCEIYNHGDYVLTCGRHTRFVNEDGSYSTEAQTLDNPTQVQFIQEGIERKPYLITVWCESKRKRKFYTMTLKNSQHYYVRVDEVTGLLVKC